MNKLIENLLDSKGSCKAIVDSILTEHMDIADDGIPNMRLAAEAVIKAYSDYLEDNRITDDNDYRKYFNDLTDQRVWAGSNTLNSVLLNKVKGTKYNSNKLDHKQGLDEKLLSLMIQAYIKSTKDEPVTGILKAYIIFNPELAKSSMFRSLYLKNYKDFYQSQRPPQ
jgi:hypothetical protein